MPNQSYGSWTHFLYVNVFFCSIDAGHVNENALQTEARIDCEQSLFSQSSLSSAGLDRVKRPRGKAFPWLLSFYFRPLRSISWLAWPSWGTARSLRLALGKKIVWREKRRLLSPEVWAAPTSKVWRHSDRASNSPFHSKRPERKHCLQGGVGAIEPPGEVLLGILGGGVSPGSLNPDLISDQRLVIFHICF